jgi:hypothetical protein
MLQSLATSGERRELIGKLEALIRQGDVAGAKQLLSAAVEMGSLAVIMIDHIDEPGLRASLQTLVTEGQNTASPVSPGRAGDGVALSEAELAESKKALERERDRADAAVQELNALQGQLAAVRTSEAELTRVLEQEKSRSTAVAREVETARSQLATLKAAEVSVAEQKAAAAREKERADAAQSQLGNMRDQLASLEAKAAAEASGLKAALRQETERSASVARELEGAKNELASLRSVESKASDLNAVLEQEKQRSVSYARELEAAREQLAILKASEAKAASAERDLNSRQPSSRSRGSVRREGRMQRFRSSPPRRLSLPLPGLFFRRSPSSTLPWSRKSSTSFPSPVHSMRRRGSFPF